MLSSSDDFSYKYCLPNLWKKGVKEEKKDSWKRSMPFLCHVFKNSCWWCLIIFADTSFELGKSDDLKSRTYNKTNTNPLLCFWMPAAILSWGQNLHLSIRQRVHKLAIYPIHEGLQFLLEEFSWITSVTCRSFVLFIKRGFYVTSNPDFYAILGYEITN